MTVSTIDLGNVAKVKPLVNNGSNVGSKKGEAISLESYKKVINESTENHKKMAMTTKPVLGGGNKSGKDSDFDGRIKAFDTRKKAE